MISHDVAPGDSLPVFTLPLTVQRLVMEAGVNRDFTPIHHDSAVARSHGAPNMFANNLLLQALFEATIREWMGLAGRLKALRFRIMARRNDSELRRRGRRDPG